MCHIVINKLRHRLSILARESLNIGICWMTRTILSNLKARKTESIRISPVLITVASHVMMQLVPAGKNDGTGKVAHNMSCIEVRLSRQEEH